MLIGQLHSLMDDEPVEQLKEKLKEIDRLNLENETLRNRVSEHEDKMLQVEADAAQQVQSVLDTNEKLQGELVKLSRDLSSVESALSEQKSICKEKVSKAEQEVKRLAEELEDSQGKVNRNNDVLNRMATQLQDEQKTKSQIVERLKVKSLELEKSADTVQTLKSEKVNISTHLWNLTEKLKTISTALESATAENNAVKVDKEQLEEELLALQNNFADKSKLCDDYFSAVQDYESKLKNTSSSLETLHTKFQKLEQESRAMKESYESRNKKLDDEVKMLTGNLQATSKKLKHFEDKSSCLPAMRKKVVEQTSIITSLQKKNKEMSKNLQETRILTKSVSDENNKLDEAVDVLKAEKQALVSRVDAIKAERDGNQRKFSELANAHENLLNENRALDDKLQETRKQFEETKENVQLIVNECQTLKEKWISKRINSKILKRH